MYVMPGSSVARTPGWSVIRGVAFGAVVLPLGAALGAGLAFATTLAIGGWSGAASFFG